MSRIRAHRSLSGAALALVGVGAMLLGGCSGRDADQSEKLAAINAALARAEAAATRAEKAARSTEGSSAPQTAEVEIDPEDNGTGNDPAAQDPNSTAFDNTAG